jgi:hypothetical protein
MNDSVKLPQSLNRVMGAVGVGKSILQAFIIEDKDNIQTALLEAEQVEVKTSIGWITLDSRDFKCGCAYRVCHD